MSKANGKENRRAGLNRREFITGVSAGVVAGSLIGAVACTTPAQAKTEPPQGAPELKNLKPKTMLIQGKYVFPNKMVNRAYQVIDNGAVYIEDGQIKDVGKTEDLKKKYKPELVLGSDEFLVMPGFCNAHHHADGFTYFQSGIVDDALEFWLKGYWYKINGLKPTVDMKTSALYSYIRNIKTGVTAVIQNDWHMGQDKYVEAAQEVGIRAAFALGIVDMPGRLTYAPDDEFFDSLPKELQDKAKAIPPWPEGKGDGEDWIVANSFKPVMEQYLKEYHQPDGRIKIFYGPMGPPWCSKPLIQYIVEGMKEHKTGAQTHLLETKYQKAYMLKKHKMSMVEFIKEIGFLSPSVSYAHGVWLSEKDIKMMADAGATVVHNPGSNLRLQSGIAPVNVMVKNGVNVALGMDGLPLQDDEDMFAEMRLAKVLQQVPDIDETPLKVGDIMQMATVNGFKGAFMANNIGCLEPGYRADVILVKLDHIVGIGMHPNNSIVDAVHYRGRGQDVDTVVIDGEVVMHGRKMTKVDEAEVEKKIRADMSKPPEKLLDKKSQEKYDALRSLRAQYTAFYRKYEEGMPLTPFYTYNSKT